MSKLSERMLKIGWNISKIRNSNWQITTTCGRKFYYNGKWHPVYYEFMYAILQLEELVSKYDWTHAMSDYHVDYDKGRKQKEAILALLQICVTSYRLGREEWRMLQWKHYDCKDKQFLLPYPKR